MIYTTTEKPDGIGPGGNAREQDRVRAPAGQISHGGQDTQAGPGIQRR